MILIKTTSDTTQAVRAQCWSLPQFCDAPNGENSDYFIVDENTGGIKGVAFPKAVGHTLQLVLLQRPPEDVHKHVETPTLRDFDRETVLREMNSILESCPLNLMLFYDRTSSLTVFVYGDLLFGGGVYERRVKLNSRLPEQLVGGVFKAISDKDQALLVEKNYSEQEFNEVIKKLYDFSYSAQIFFYEAGKGIVFPG